MGEIAMRYLLVFLFLFSDLFGQSELPVLRSKNVYDPNNANTLDSQLATMQPPVLVNGWTKWSELNFQAPRLIGKNERIGIIIIGIVPETSDLLICTSLDTQNHNVVARVNNWNEQDYTHDTRAYGWHYYTINKLISDYSIVSLVWGLGSKPYNFDTVKIDAVFVYVYEVEDTIEVPIDTVDTTVLHVKEAIRTFPNGFEEVGIWNQVGVSHGKKSVNNFVTFNDAPDGLYFTSEAQWFMKRGKRYFWRKK